MGVQCCISRLIFKKLFIIRTMSTARCVPMLPYCFGSYLSQTWTDFALVWINVMLSIRRCSRHPNQIDLDRSRPPREPYLPERGGYQGRTDPQPSWNFFLFSTYLYNIALKQNHVEYLVNLLVLFFTNIENQTLYLVHSCKK